MRAVTVYPRIPSPIATVLQPHAKRRGIPVATLVQRIIEAVANDDIVDAVLDDKESAQ